MSRTRAILFAVALLAVVVGVSAGVGFASHGRGFDWSVASVFGTALGTTLLAVATLALAYSTWQDVRASQRIAEVTSKSLQLAESERQERVRPAVIGTVTGFNGNPPSALRPFLEIEIHNVGGGVAIDIVVSPEYAGDGEIPVDAKTLPMLLPGATLPLAVEFSEDVSPVFLGPFETEDFRLRGTYRDRLGRWVHDGDHCPPSAVP
jgi:hypothetical protein